MFRGLSTVSLVLLLVAVMAGYTQAQQIGYANQQAILGNMPEMQQVQQTLQQEAKKQQQQFQQRQQKLQKQIQQYRQQQSMLADSAQQRREQELVQRQEKLQKSMQQQQQQLRKREQELMQPLLEDLQSAIDSVAAQRNLEVVMRSDALLFVDQNSNRVVDITVPVAQALNVTLSQPPTEPAPSVDPSTTPTGGGGQR